MSKAIQSNNITLGALSVVDGLYRYNIHFDSQLLNREDIENVYINHEGRLVQLKDLCRVEEKLASRAGLVRHDGKNAVTMAVIKQNDAQMEDLQESIEGLVEDLRKEYPDISFDLTRDQTRLLTYSIDNLEQNLYVGAVLACLVLFLFMKDWRLPLLIIITIPLTLIVTLLSFHLLDISLNIISLSGLILGVGMIVDNSIIVIDNVMQRWRQGMPACGRPRERNERGVHPDVEFGADHLFGVCPVDFPERHRRCLVLRPGDGRHDSLVRLAFRGGVGHSGVFHGVVPEKKNMSGRRGARP